MVGQWIPLVIAASLAGVSLAATELDIDGPHFVEYGGTIQLTCNATGDLPSDIEWFKDGHKLDAFSSGLMITKRLSLMPRSLVSRVAIERSTYEDAGTYVCRSANPDKIDSIKVMVLKAIPNDRRGTPGYTDEPVVDYTEAVNVSDRLTAHADLTLFVLALVLGQQTL